MKEIFAMILQPHLLLAYVDLFDVIDKFLLEPVGIIILLAHIFFEKAGNAFPDLLLAQWFQLRYLFLLLLDVGDSQPQVFLQGSAFIQPMLIEVINGAKEYLLKYLPLFFR